MDIFIPKSLDEIKGLPEDFYYDVYQKFSKESNLGRWAIEFVTRQDGMTKEKLLKLTKGYSNNIDGSEMETIWKNGVFTGGGVNTHDSINFIENINNKYLNEAKGVFVPDDEKHKDKYKNVTRDYKINTNMGNPRQNHYQKYHGKLGKTYFPNGDIYREYHNKVNRFNNQTASFLVNIEMPTNKIIEEIKVRLNAIKANRNIQEVNYKNMFSYWAMGLACHDLRKQGLERTDIIRRYLSYCYLGEQMGDHEKLEDVHNNWYKNTHDTTTEMIKHNWKRLTGYPQ